MGRRENTRGSDSAEQEALRRIERARESRAGTLDLSNLGLRTLPGEVGCLTALTELNLRENELSALPGEIGQLAALTTLDLRRNELATLPGEIGRLTALVTLDLGFNRLSTLPVEIGQLTALTGLYLGGNQSSTLPAEIGRLTELTTLAVHNNRLSALSGEIGQLTELTTLDLGRNQLRTLPPEIGHLTALTALGLYGNQLSTLPGEIDHLTALTMLVLGRNQLRTLPPEIGHLTALTMLDLTHNRLRTLPTEIQRLSRLKELYLHDNAALGIPSEVLGPTMRDVESRKGKPAAPAEILNYYFRLHPPGGVADEGEGPAEGKAAGARPLNEAKILVVGEPGVGKTALVYWLVHDRQHENPEWTKGIEIETWNVPAAAGAGNGPIRVNVWDFGGQEIMQATHQFFLTERSLYLLVVDSRENEEQSKIRYWLDKIRAFGGDSPVIIVLNKRDEGSYEPDEARLRKDYAQNLKDPFFRTACKKGGTVHAGHGVEELREAVRGRVRQLDNVCQPVPAVFLKAKAAFEKQSGELKRMERSAFDVLCCENGLQEELDHNTLLSYLKSLGSLFHYKRPGRDHKTLVLDPGWLTGGVYKIITDLELRERGTGVLRPEDVPRIFGGESGYPDDARRFILDMMEGDPFELCFRIPDTDDHRLIPELLAPSEPNHGIEPADSLNLQYHYRYLPGGLIPRFIVRMHNVLSRGDYWRNGAVLNIDGRRVLVRGVREERRVYVSVQGREPAARRALAVVRHNLGMVHGAMKHLKVEERVPLPEQPEITVSYQYLVEQERDEGALWEWRPEGAKRKYSVRELLEGIEGYRVPEEKAMERTEPLVTGGGEVFISYAHEKGDATYGDEVRKLANDLRAWGVEAWIDQYIELPGPAEGWPRWMEARIEKAEAVLVACSPAYLRRVKKEEQAGVGHGATWEGHLMWQHLYNAGTINRKFVPVVLRKEFAKCIPVPLQAFNHYKLYETDGFERLYRALTGQPRVIAPPLGKPRSLAAVE